MSFALSKITKFKTRHLKNLSVEEIVAFVERRFYSFDGDIPSERSTSFYVPENDNSPIEGQNPPVVSDGNDYEEVNVAHRHPVGATFE